MAKKLSVMLVLFLGLSVVSGSIIGSAADSLVERWDDLAPGMPTATNSLYLDGSNDYVSVANQLALNPGDAITIEAWVYPQVSAICETIVDKNWTQSYYVGLCYGRVRAYFGGFSSMRTGNLALPLNVWSHVAVTFDGTTRRYYVNGMLDYESSGTPGSIGANMGELRIGIDFNGLNAFQGSIAELRLWGVARTLAQIRADMVHRIAAPQAGLIALWRLDGSAEDAFGEYPGTTQGGAGFSGVPSYPTDFDPIQIPRMAGPASVDGVCSPGEYENLMLPIWYAEPYDSTNLAWVMIGATDSDIYVCLKNLEWGMYAGQQVAMYIDPDNDAGANAQSDDYRVRLTWPGNVASIQQGNGAGDYSATTFSDYSAAGSGPEFYWSAEFRFSRSSLPSPDAIFGLQFIHHAVNAASNDYGWPDAFDWNTPNAWRDFQINDAVIPRADSANPEVETDILPGADVAYGDSVTLVAYATDDVDVAKVEWYVDYILVHPCNYGGENDRTPVSCTYADASYTVGSHYYYALVYDHRGRRSASSAQFFIVRLDGIAPQISLDVLPNPPSAGDPITLIVHATDAAGIEEIYLDTDLFFRDRTCHYAPGQTSVTCSLSFTPPAGRRVFYFSASARDYEYLTTRTDQRLVVLDNSGPDSDNDGLSDPVESLTCTDSNNPDSDHDGLNDGWEVFGLKFDDYTIDLPGLGSGPCHPDVFLQLDWNASSPVAMLDKSQVVNIFRDHGITLHISGKEHPAASPAVDCNVSSLMAASQTDSTGDYYFHPRLNWTHYYAYARNCLGRSFSVPPIFFTIDMRSKYAGSEEVVRPGTIGSTIFHELGHTMGLDHGGNRSAINPRQRNGALVYYVRNEDLINLKPNYISSMNYLYNASVFCVNSEHRIQSPEDFSENPMPTLAENSLDERPASAFAYALRGLSCPAPGYLPVVKYTCLDPDEDNAPYLMFSDGERTIARRHYLRALSYTDIPLNPPGIDWNCNGLIEPSVTGSINGDGDEEALPTLADACDGVDNDDDGYTDEGCPDKWVAGENLTAYADWRNLPMGRNCVVYWDSSGNPPPEYRALIGGPSCFSLTMETSESLRLSNEQLFNTPVIGSSPILPDLESCDGVNNDGDDQVDEDCPDGDGDGLIDALDNCPETDNIDQADFDSDYLGEACQYPQVSNLQLFAAPPKGFHLSWDGPAADILGYNVYRLLPGEDTPRFLARVTLLSYDDYISPPDWYWYEVRPVNLNGEEGPGVILSTRPVIYLPLLLREE